MITFYPMLVYIMLSMAGLIDPAAICSYTTRPWNGFDGAGMECYIPAPTLEEEPPQKDTDRRKSPRLTRAR